MISCNSALSPSRYQRSIWSCWSANSGGRHSLLTYFCQSFGLFTFYISFPICWHIHTPHHVARHCRCASCCVLSSELSVCVLLSACCVLCPCTVPVLLPYLLVVLRVLYVPFVSGNLPLRCRCGNLGMYRRTVLPVQFTLVRRIHT